VLSELVNILRMERQQGQKEWWSASLTDMSNGDGPTPRPWLTSSFLDSTANISLYLIVVNVLGTSSNSGVKEKLSCMPRDPVFYYNLSGSCAGGNKMLTRILYNVLLFMNFTATCTMLCHHLAFFIYIIVHISLLLPAGRPSTKESDPPRPKFNLNNGISLDEQWTWHTVTCVDQQATSIPKRKFGMISSKHHQIKLRGCFPVPPIICNAMQRTSTKS
jgi:hypothetical protein